MADKYPGGAAELFFREKKNIPYDTLVFGMSHSLNGIYEWFLTGTAFKFSVPSVDLRYQLRLLRQVEKRYDLDRVKHLVLELPYYIFNYDLEKAKNTFALRKAYMEYLDDLEAENVPPTAALHSCSEIKHFLMQEQEKLRNVLRRQRTNPGEIHVEWSPEEIQKMREELPHVWGTIRPETLEETPLLLREILELVERHPGLDLTILVCPFCPFFMEGHAGAIEKMKEIFYDKLEEAERMQAVKPVVLDLFSLYREHPEYFLDHCHLNGAGALAFTGYLAKSLGRGCGNNS